MIAMQEWHMMEGLADYSFTEPEPDSQAGVYQLVAQPTLMDKIKQLQQKDQATKWVRERLLRAFQGEISYEVSKLHGKASYDKASWSYCEAALSI